MSDIMTENDTEFQYQSEIPEEHSSDMGDEILSLPSQDGRADIIRL